MSGSDTTYDFEPETPCTTTCYVNAATGNDAFGGGTLANPKKTIQAAIDTVTPGGEVRVLPGNYSETATGRWVLGTNGPHQFGLFIDKDGVTVQGVSAGDVALTDYNALGAYITTNATNNFGTSGIFVEGDNVTLAGLRIGPNAPSDNKTIEIIGDGFTLKDSHVDVPGGGSVYFGDWQFDTVNDISHIQTYTLDHNLIDQSTSVDIASGAGYSGSASGRQIINNKFENSDYWPSISFNGSGTGVPWFVQSVGGAVIENNDFTNTYNGTEVRAGHIRVRGDYNNAQFDWTAYWNNNTFNKATVILDGAYPPFNVREYNYMSGSYSFDVRRIGVTIQGSVDKAVAGDTVLVKAGTYPESPNLQTSLTLKGESGRDATFIQLQTGPTYLGGLTVDAPIVTVDGFTLVGFDAVGSGLASSNIVVTTLPDTVLIQNNRLRVGAIDSGSNGDDGMGLITYYNEASDVDSLTVLNNLFEPLNASGARAFYINPGVNHFTFRGNQISGNFTGTAITQAKDGLVEENTVTGVGAAGSRSAGLGTWGYPDPTIYGHTLFRNNVIAGVWRGIAVNETNNVTIENNFLDSNDNGAWIESFGLGQFDPTTILIQKNSLANNHVDGLNNLATGQVNAEKNWWGSNLAVTVAAEVNGNADYTPWLCFGTDTSPAIGFQPLLITDCTAPVTSNVVAAPNPVPVNGSVALTANVDDTLTGGSNIASAQYRIDLGGWVAMNAQDGAFDEANENVAKTFTAPSTAGVYDLCVRGTDAVGNVSAEECILLVVYDPTGGFVTGGGWFISPAGAYLSDPAATGKASFGFVSKYKRGMTVPTGNTEFQFRAGNVNFQSVAYDWLVIAGTKAQYKGTGTINGASSPNGLYRFLLTARDTNPDTFRIKIWWEDGAGEHVVYDNGSDQALGGGAIVIHK